MTSHTRAEIEQQPAVWRASVPAAVAAREAVAALLADPATRIVLTGAGTSAYAGQLLAPDLSRLLDRPVEAVATTDIVTDPGALTAGDRPILLVSFARSGNSPESVAAAELVDRLSAKAHHLVVTCNAGGALAARWRDVPNAVVVTLPPETNDKGFAMTSSFTSMVLAAYLSLGGEADVERLAQAATVVLANAADTGLRPERIVYLGSGALTGLAREAALKCLELTAGGVIALSESSLGFRHGPKAVLTPRTVAAVFVSGDEHRRAYDLDIARELTASLGPGRVVLVTDEEHPGSAVRWHVPRPPGLPDSLWALAAVIPAQLFALELSLAAGLTPDNPFPGGEVNRVVQGVTIHDYTPGR